MEEQRPEEERREADRRESDMILAETLREFMEDVKTFIGQVVHGELVLADGRTTGDITREHDQQVIAQTNLAIAHNVHAIKLDKVVTLLEGEEIQSPITGVTIGHTDGLVAKVDNLTETATRLTEAVSNETPLRVKREWTQAQQWAIGIALTIAGGILISLIPIAIALARAAGLPSP